MDVTGLVILILTIAFFVAMGIFAVVKGRDLRWPEGKRSPINHKTGGGWIKVHVIASPKFSGRMTAELSQACVMAVACTYEAWAQKFPDTAPKVYEDFRNIAVHLLTDYEYDQLDGKDQWIDGTNGTVGKVGRMFGNGIWRIIVRSKFADQIMRHGGIVTHEAVHVANRAAGNSVWDDAAHKTPGVFGANDEGTVEYQARVNFQA